MSEKNRLTPPADEVKAQAIVQDRKVDEHLKRFISDVVMNGKAPDHTDALVIAYALMEVAKDSRGRKLLGLSALGRGKGKKSKANIARYPRDQFFNEKNIVQITLRYMAGMITQDQACQELRVMIGDDANEDIDHKTLCTMLDEACTQYRGEYQIFGDLIIK